MQNGNDLGNRPRRVIKVDMTVILLYCIISACVMLLGFSAFSTFRFYKQKAHCTEKVTAVVEDYERGHSKKQSHGRQINTYFPVFRYTYEGEEYLVKSNVGSNEKQYEIGDEAEIFIDPDSPEHISIPGNNLFYILLAVVGAAALIVLIVCVIKLLMHLKSKKQTEQI